MYKDTNACFIVQCMEIGAVGLDSILYICTEMQNCLIRRRYFCPQKDKYEEQNYFF